MREADEPQPERRRRKGETEGGMRRPAAPLNPAPAARGRYVALRPLKAEEPVQRIIMPASPTTATVYLADTLDWLNLWQANANHEQWPGDDFSAKQDHYFPQP